MTVNPFGNIFFTTVSLIGRICENSLKINGIDELFRAHGADSNWRSNDVIPLWESRKANRVYGWMKGIHDHMPEKTYVIARDILVTFSRSLSTVPAADRKLSADLVRHIETTLKLPASGSSHSQVDQRVSTLAGALYANQHYSEAVRKVFVALVDEVKSKSQRFDLDGEDLMNKVFSPKQPILRFSAEPSEQEGCMSLFKGAVAIIRNPLSHVSDIKLSVDEAHELLWFASFLFRTLDRTSLTSRPNAVQE